MKASLAVLLISLASTSAFAKMAMPKSPTLPHANFQLCFEVSNARCFTVDASKPGFLRQVTALHDSEAKVTSSQTHKFKNEILALFKSIANAKVEKMDQCHKGLSFRLLDPVSKEPTADLRCLDNIGARNEARVKDLADRLATASKPRRK